ncbi:hypothetical protein NL676_023831 [Syzygium grande]|nr:hypothetical protein NL676_023831 [Syzygium grande]
MGHGSVRMLWPRRQRGTPRWIETASGGEFTLVTVFTARLGLQDLARTLKWSCWRWRRLEHYEGVAVLQRLRARRNCFVVDVGDSRRGPSRPLVWPRGRWWRWLKHAVAGRHGWWELRRRCRRPGTGGTVGHTAQPILFRWLFSLSLFLTCLSCVLKNCVLKIMRVPAS